MKELDITTVLLDMGGVVLHMAGSRGFPESKLDWRGRRALMQEVRRAGGHLQMDDLETWVFGPWHQEYIRRAELVREADWTPHLDRLRRKSGCELSDVELLSAWFAPYGERLEPLEGVEPALRSLVESGFRLALVSNVPLPGELYDQVLDRHQLAKFFDALVFSYDAGSRKPSPAMLRRAMAAVGGEPAETIMVGDRRDRDVAAGRFAAVRTVWLRSEDGGGPDANWVIASLSQLPQLLSDLRG